MKARTEDARQLMTNCQRFIGFWNKAEITIVLNHVHFAVFRREANQKCAGLGLRRATRS
jgi:hypothetical protein